MYIKAITHVEIDGSPPPSINILEISNTGTETTETTETVFHDICSSCERESCHYSIKFTTQQDITHLLEEFKQGNFPLLSVSYLPKNKVVYEFLNNILFTGIFTSGNYIH